MQVVVGATKGNIIQITVAKDRIAFFRRMREIATFIILFAMLATGFQRRRACT